MENKLSAEKLAEVKAIGQQGKAQGIEQDNSPISEYISPSNTPNVASTSSNDTTAIAKDNQPRTYRPDTLKSTLKTKSKSKGRSL
ncbi:MAG TPA: hypothetical protein PLC89_25180 [Haliscomenobacter sp.]|uniref:hypothetical protein n=1 Tax=Haliscomenobacter sp. TaxID=2717303 RepID=UPI002D03FD7F|nr:hypothetical protein [Haliscomenobacter sp.]HOY20629.1 hypothetical protein [Haliscomenobacter sp.]